MLSRIYVKILNLQCYWLSRNQECLASRNRSIVTRSNERVGSGDECDRDNPPQTPPSVRENSLTIVLYSTREKEGGRAEKGRREKRGNFEKEKR